MTRQTTQPVSEASLSEYIERLSRFDGPPGQFIEHLLELQCRLSGASGGAILRIGVPRAPEARAQMPEERAPGTEGPRNPGNAASATAAQPDTPDAVAAGQGQTEILCLHPAQDPGTPPPPWLREAVRLVPRQFGVGGADPAARQAAGPVVIPLAPAGGFFNQSPDRCILLLPLRSAGAGGQPRTPGAGAGAMAVFLLPTADGREVDQARQKLELTAGLLAAYELHLTLRRQGADTQRLRQAMELLAAVNRSRRFVAAAMAFCNEVAARWSMDRVSLGLLPRAGAPPGGSGAQFGGGANSGAGGRYIRMRAMSHTEKFVGKTALVQDLEGVMEECLDQDVEVMYPAPVQTPVVNRVVTQFAAKAGYGRPQGGHESRSERVESRAGAEEAEKKEPEEPSRLPASGGPSEGRGGSSGGGGPITVLSLPLRQEGAPVGVLTVERTADRPVTLDEAEALRLTCDLCAARLLDLFDHDKWIGARAAEGLRRGLAALIGPRHTWAKAAALGLLAAGLFLALAKGPDRVEATFVLEAQDRRPISAPFDAKLLAVEAGIEPGKKVLAGQLLATLDITPLLDRLDSATSEKLSYEKEADLAMNEAADPLKSGKIAEAQVASARARKADAEIRLLQWQIAQAQVRAPMAGQIVSGDPQRQVGQTLKTGDVLVEVAAPEPLKADLFVPEDRIAELRVGGTGELATASDPGQHISFVIERINPVAEVIKQRNVFRVRAALVETRKAGEQESTKLGAEDWQRLRAGLHPGMEGLAKVDVGRRSYAVLWTRSLVNWVRMKLWI